MEQGREQGRPKTRKQRCIRWVANAMIILGLLAVPGYFLGSCGYTWLEQRALREDIAQHSPYLTADISALIQQGSVSVGAGGGSTTDTTASVQTSPSSAAERQTQSTSVTGTVGTGVSLGSGAEAELSELDKFREAAKAFDRSVKAGEPIGRIVIPAIELDVVVIEGTGKTDLKQGPGHWPETPFPGGGGNFVVSGHRTTYGAPFLHLDDLVAGDDIYVVLPYAIAHYQVGQVFIVYPDEVETVAQRGKEQISLAACHPIYSAKQRIVVQGDLVSFALHQ